MATLTSNRRLPAWPLKAGHALLRHVWLLPIVFAALWLRLSGITSQHLYGDEAEYAIVARYLSRDALFLAYPQMEGFGPTPFVSQPPLILYVMALFMKVMGPTDLAAQLPSVLFGTATCVVLYFLGLRLGSRFMGIAAAALIAVMPFHVEMSRQAMLDAGYVFFLALTAYFLVAWIQTRREAARAVATGADDAKRLLASARRNALGVGVATACACLSKLPGILSGPVVAIVFLVALVAVVVRKLRGRAHKGEVAETLLQGGIGAAPVALGALLYMGLLAYLNAISNLWIKLQWQLGRVDTAQAKIAEVTAVHRDWTFYFTDKEFSFYELMGSLVMALAFVGLATALVRWLASRGRHGEHFVVPLMTAVLLGFFLYSDRKEGFYLLPFAPLAAILVANSGEGLRRMLAWANLRFTPKLARRLAPVALAAGIVLVFLPTYAAAGDSYEEFILGDNQEQYFGYGTREAAHFIHQKDPTAIQYGTLLGRFTLHWYNEQPSYHWYVDHSFVESQIQNGKLRYIVYDDYLQLAFDREYMKELINKYNGEAVARYRQGWGEVTVFELHP